MASLEDAARAQAEAVHLSTKAEIVDYYRDNFPKNWTRHAAEALSGTTDHKSKEYRAAIRQFQGSRIDQAGGKLAPKFEAVGKQLPPDHYNPKGDVTVNVTASQKADSKGGTRERDFTANFSGSDAYAFVNNPTLRQVLKAQGNYNDDLIDLLTGESYGGDYALYDISA